MKPRADVVFHEGAHVAAARLLGVRVDRVTFHASAFNGGNAGLTYLADAANCSPLDRAIIS